MAITNTTVSRSLPRPALAAATSAAAVQVWLAGVILLVFAMIVVGGATRLTDSGLSITEWLPLLGVIPPLTDADWQVAFDKYKQIPEYRQVNAGMSLAEFQFIYWWEWAHRFLGRVIGLAFAIPLAIFWWRGMLPTRLKPVLLMLLVLGGLQGFVGWYMVQSGLVDRVDVSQYRLALHLSLAFLILGVLVATLLSVSPRPAAPTLKTVGQGSAWVVGMLVALVYAQVALGAFVAGTKAGLTYNTWPLMDGDLVPGGLWVLEPWWRNVTENITAIQFNHRVSAYLLVVLAIAHALWLWRRADAPGVVASSAVLAVAIIAQAVFGIWTLLAADGAIPIGLGLVHQGGAAVVLAIAVWHAVRFFEMRAA
ncbi:MAG: COX15/CtaA family protein [Pseudomonadota bacterium]